MRMLAVQEKEENYVGYYEVTYAASLADAKNMIIEAEQNGQPFEALDLPVNDFAAFWKFIDWLEETKRLIPFAVYGIETFGKAGYSVFEMINKEAYRRGMSHLT